ncbi:hypothetical protein [Geobacillus zalihae]|uniref:hypothetical protein n=1 Tax=Geobacillus zalihae TaxID=213419 RepID=UPI001CC20B44|nr:hypothetical protein [Geobacillus zalihae]
MNSWLIRWYYYIFMENGRCVWSYESLIDNKGFDGSGVHKVKFDRFNQKNIGNLQKDNFKFENNLAYNEKLIREFRRYFNGKGVWEKIKTIIYLSTGLILEKPKRLGD